MPTHSSPGPSRPPKAALLAVVLAAACFGSTGTAQALGAGDGSPTSVGAARVVAGGLLLAVLALVLRRPRGVPPVPDLLLVLTGAVGVAAYQPTFFTGTDANGVAVGTLVAIGAAPVLTGVLEAVVLRRRPAPAWWLSTALAASGVAVLAGVLSGAAGSLSATGLLASLGAGASYAVYTLTSKALLDRGWSSLGAMGATFGGAGLLMVPVLLSTPLGWVARPEGAATVAWLAVVTIAVAYILFARGLNHLPAAHVATLSLVEPLTAALLGIAILGEAFTLDTAVGAALLLAGLAVLAGPRRPAPVTPHPWQGGDGTTAHDAGNT